MDIQLLKFPSIVGVGSKFVGPLGGRFEIVESVIDEAVNESCLESISKV